MGCSTRLAATSQGIAPSWCRWARRFSSPPTVCMCRFAAQSRLPSPPPSPDNPRRTRRPGHAKAHGGARRRGGARAVPGPRERPLQPAGACLLAFKPVASGARGRSRLGCLRRLRLEAPATSLPPRRPLACILLTLTSRSTAFPWVRSRVVSEGLGFTPGACLLAPQSDERFRNRDIALVIGAVLPRTGSGLSASCSARTRSQRAGGTRGGEGIGYRDLVSVILRVASIRVSCGKAWSGRPALGGGGGQWINPT